MATAFAKACKLHITYTTPEGETIAASQLFDQSIPTLAAIGAVEEKAVSDANGVTSHFIINPKATKVQQLRFDCIKEVFDEKIADAKAAEAKRMKEEDIKLAQKSIVDARQKAFDKMKPEELEDFISKTRAQIDELDVE